MLDFSLPSGHSFCVYMCIHIMRGFQLQKKHYRHAKRRATNELLSTLQDPSVIIIADWLKVRGSLRSWTKLWSVLKPGLLVLYKSDKAKVCLLVVIVCRSMVECGILCKRVLFKQKFVQLVQLYVQASGKRG